MYENQEKNDMLCDGHQELSDALPHTQQGEGESMTRLRHRMSYGKTQLTGLSDYCRRLTVMITGTHGVTPVGEAVLSPLQAFTYSPCGDLLATHTYTNSTDIITETYSYLDWGKVSSAVNAAASLNAPVPKTAAERILIKIGFDCQDSFDFSRWWDGTVRF